MPSSFFQAFSRQQLTDKMAAAAQLNAGITALTDIKFAKKTDPRKYFSNVTRWLELKIDEKNGSLADGYLALIRFYGYDGTNTNRAITPEMLRACHYINALNKDDLNSMDPNFKASFVEMIKNCLDFDCSDNGMREQVQLAIDTVKYKEKRISETGKIVESAKEADKYLMEGQAKIKENINILQTAFTVLRQDQVLQSIQHSGSFHPVPG